jgi:hypothetical protein
MPFRMADNLWDSRASSDTGSLVDINLSEPVLRQPWIAFWPVKGTGEATVWHHSEFPEVISWQFNPNRPFDRPWRKWTRTVKAKKETASLQLAVVEGKSDTGKTIAGIFGLADSDKRCQTKQGHTPSSLSQES